MSLQHAAIEFRQAAFATYCDGQTHEFHGINNRRNFSKLAASRNADSLQGQRAAKRLNCNPLLHIQLFSPVREGALQLILFMHHSRSTSSRSLFFVFALLWIGAVCSLAGAQTALPLAANGPVSKGNAKEVAAVMQLLLRLDQAVGTRDASTLGFFGLEAGATQASQLQAQTRATHIAFAPTGALVRQAFRITGIKNNSGTASTLAEGVHEFWLSRALDGSFHFTEKKWAAPYDAVRALNEAAAEEWNRPVPARGTPLLHLVVARRGGRWVALRRSRWDGAILDAPQLAVAAGNQSIAPGYYFDPQWLRSQMRDAPTTEPGTAHMLLQKSQAGWIGVGMAWEADRKLSAQSDIQSAAARRAILGESYELPSAHRAFGIALGQVGLFQEAADELEKAEALQPGIVSPALLQQVQSARPRDLENLAITQLQDEARVGLDPNHPSYIVSALAKDYQTQPSILRALRLGLEYSRLGDDDRATAWLRAAQGLVGQGALRSVSPSDGQWIQVLSEHLEERRRLAAQKPTNTIRSPLFTLRAWPNERAAVQVLASLEAAQHTVYADFGIPMSSTEVLLWRSQGEFQRYVTKFSQQGNSEFVAALTLTKLIATRNGPVVLGEEINVFTDPRTTVFSTVAHEYGHVAVRQLSRGRDVPVWFNEGVATSVEGGYDGYLERVRSAANVRALLPMNELLQWEVDGERAFLAYSQANSMIDYIIVSWGKEAVLNILRRIGNDEPADAAFQSVLGISQQELWRRWAREGIK